MAGNPMGKHADDPREVFATAEDPRQADLVELWEAQIALSAWPGFPAELRAVEAEIERRIGCPPASMPTFEVEAKAMGDYVWYAIGARDAAEAAAAIKQLRPWASLLDEPRQRP